MSRGRLLATSEPLNADNNPGWWRLEEDIDDYYLVRYPTVDVNGIAVPQRAETPILATDGELGSHLAWRVSEGLSDSQNGHWVVAMTTPDTVAGASPDEDPEPVETAAAFVPWATSAVSGQFNFSQVYRLQLGDASQVDVIQEVLTLAEGVSYVAFTVSAVVGATSNTQLLVYEALVGGGGEPVTVGPFLPEEPDLGALHVFNRNYPAAANEDRWHDDTEDDDLPFPEVYAEDGFTQLTEQLPIIRGDWFKYTDSLDPLIPGDPDRPLLLEVGQSEGTARWVRQVRGRAQLIGTQFTGELPELSGLIDVEVIEATDVNPRPPYRQVRLLLRQSGVEFPIEIDLRQLDRRSNWLEDAENSPDHILNRPSITLGEPRMMGSDLHDEVEFIHMGQGDAVEDRSIFVLNLGYPFKFEDEANRLQIPPRIWEPDDGSQVDADNTLVDAGDVQRYIDGHGMVGAEFLPVPLLSEIGGKELFILNTEALAMTYNALDDKVTALETRLEILEARIP